MCQKRAEGGRRRGARQPAPEPQHHSSAAPIFTWVGTPYRGDASSTNLARLLLQNTLCRRLFQTAFLLHHTCFLTPPYSHDFTLESTRLAIAQQTCLDSISSFAIAPDHLFQLPTTTLIMSTETATPEGTSFFTLRVHKTGSPRESYRNPPPTGARCSAPWTKGCKALPCHAGSPNRSCR